MSKIAIDQEIADVCPALKEQEAINLEESLKREGCRDPLILWGKILLDGHNRFSICNRLDIPYTTVQVKDIGSHEQAVNWVIDNQLGRRNVSQEERQYLIGRRYNLEKLAHAKAGAAGAAVTNAGSQGHDDPDWSSRGRTSTKIAKETGVGERTVRRAGEFSEAVDRVRKICGPVMSRRIRSGSAKLSHDAVVQLSMEKTKKDMTAKFQEILDNKKKQRPIKSSPEPIVVGDKADQPPPATVQEEEPKKKRLIMPVEMIGQPKMPNPLDEVIRLESLWSTNWFEDYCKMLQQAGGEEAALKLKRANTCIGPLMYKLNMLASTLRTRVKDLEKQR